MYESIKYSAETEDGFRLERQYYFDEENREIGSHILGTSVVDSPDGEELDRSSEDYKRIAATDDGFVSEVAVIMDAEDDVYDLPSSAEEAEGQDFVELRSIDTLPIGYGDIRVFCIEHL